MRKWIEAAAWLMVGVKIAAGGVPVPVGPNTEPMADGPYKPDWKSLQTQQTPDWYRDAKFGIWAHWTAQCVPEHGDWYARGMYETGSDDYKFHVAHYGPQSQFGFKDIDNAWHAENWDPEKLMSLYQAAGAQYFFALANHHDNFDCFDSKYQPWNSTKIGPKKDIVGTWAEAARRHGMKFGVSVHASHAWSWFEPSQGADKTGPLAGVPYDGRIQAADGAGKWWDGLDPQDLYCQNHKPGGLSWDWDPKKCTIPDQAYVDKFYDRTIDLINKYHPDLLYFDDTRLPLAEVSDAGLKIAAHYYNQSVARDGSVQVVQFGKGLDPDQRKGITWDIERGKTDHAEPLPWQTDTCIGSWHYDRRIFDQHHYKSVDTVVHTLVDNVSKNGNLLLSVPVRGDGSIDEDEVAFLHGLADWMTINKEAIFGTRPWGVYGEGPSTTGQRKGGANFNEGRAKPFTAEDVRFTKKGNDVYAMLMAWPADGKATIRSMATGMALYPGDVGDVTLLGAGPVKWTRDDAGLHVELPEKVPSAAVCVLKVTGK